MDTQTIREINTYADLVESAMLSFKNNYNPESELYIDNIDAHLDLLRTTHYIQKLLELTKPEYVSQSS